VRSFYEFLLREGRSGEQGGPQRRPLAGRRSTERVTRNPAHDVPAPKAVRRLPQTLDADQMARLLQIPAGGGLTARDRAIMELLYSSGLRLAELVGLDVTSLDLKDRMVQVLGKARRPVSFAVGRAAAQALRLWLKERAALAKEQEAALFVGRSARASGAAGGAGARGLLGAAPGAWGARAPAPVPAFVRFAPAGVQWRVCAECRNCWVMPTSRPPRSTPILISSISPVSTTLRTRGRAERPEARKQGLNSRTRDVRRWKPMSDKSGFNPHGTTILGVRRDGALALAEMARSPSATPS